MKKIIFTIITLLFTITLITKPVHAYQITPGYVTYQTKLEYSGKSSLENVSIYQLSFQTQDVQTFDYVYITDLNDFLIYSHLIPAEYYIYVVPVHNVVSLQVYNYSFNNVIHTFNQISYIIFDFNLGTVTFRSDSAPLIPLVLTNSDINNADTSINLLIQNDPNSIQKGYDDGYDDGYLDGENDGYNNGYQHGNEDAFNDARLEYGYYDGNNYITADEYGLSRYNTGLDENREYYGYFNGTNWITAEQWGNIEYNRGYELGLTSEIDWFNWAFTFITMPVRILNVEVLPGIKIGYFALFTLMTGIVSWFFFIVGKGGRRK